MDLITQMALGAAVGQFGYQRQLGNRAIVWGGIIGTVPDLDVVVKWMSDPYAEILYHRGVTHSLFFGPILGPLLGYLLWQYYGRQREHIRAWIGLMIAALITHPLLDVMTVYGTQLLAPFSNHRFVFSAIPIVEPVYTVPLLLCIILGLVWGTRRPALNQVLSGITLLLTTCYLFLGLSLNDKTTTYVEHQLKDEHMVAEKINVYTTMFQLPLRRVVVHTPTEYWIGLVSMWDPQPVQWTKFPKAPSLLLQEFEKTRDFHIFDWFTSGDYGYMAEPAGDHTVLTMTDLRYGFRGESLLGLWGLRCNVDNKGLILSPIKAAGINRVALMERFLDVKAVFKLAFAKKLEN